MWYLKVQIYREAGANVMCKNVAIEITILQVNDNFLIESS